MKFFHLLLLISLANSPVFANEKKHEPAGKSGWQIFAELQNGNMRFYEGQARHEHQDIKTREQLAGGQNPHTIILSCADSRVPPEMIFDQGLGDLFVVRIAGNTVNPEAIASIEYAVEHLDPKLLLIMGHESCGAVKAAVETKPDSSAGSPSLDVLVKKIQGNIGRSGGAALGDKTLRVPVKANVRATAEELLEKSPIVNTAVKSGKLILAHGIYSLASGRVEFWDVGAKGSMTDIPREGPQIVDSVIKSEEIKKPARRH